MTRSRFDVALAVLCGLAAAVLAAFGSGSVALAAHDAGAVRTAGAGYTGVLRALDLVLAAPGLLLPWGTRVFRAGLASAILAGLAAALAFELARGLVGVVTPVVLRKVLARRARASGPEVSPRLASAVSCVAVLSAALAPAFQAEASAPGGALPGVVLLLGLVRLAAIGQGPRGPLVALGLGLAVSWDPLVALVAAAALAPWAADLARGVDRTPTGIGQVVVSFALGLLPLALALALRARAPELALAPVPAVASGASAARLAMMPALTGFALAEVGLLFLLAGALGLGLAFAVAPARRLAAALALLVGGSLLALRLDPSGRAAAPLLAGFVAIHVLAVSTLGLVVLAIARTRLPFAEVSAALVVVLELVLPVRAFDETTVRRAARATDAAAVWSDVAWGDLPPAAVLVVADPRTMNRIASARAQGHMRDGLIVVPAFDVQGRAGQNALLAEPKLAPLYRDLALGIAPEELSLSQLGGERPVLATFDPKWERTLARHLVPVGLTSRFEPEPRGASDRKRALDAFAPLRDRLLRVSIARKDPELAAASALLLRARAIGVAATGERENLSQTLDDLRQFAPDDALHATLVRRLLTTKGAIDVRDLAP